MIVIFFLVPAPCAFIFVFIIINFLVIFLVVVFASDFTCNMIDNC
jgi:hypothetical protein